MTLDDPENKSIRRLQKITSKTLISGYSGSSRFVDKLWGKTIVIYDFAEMMSKHPDEKAAIFAQFRDLYDGIAGGSYGTGIDELCKGKPPQVLAGSTHAIYDEYLLHSQLGTREMLYRVDTADANRARERAMKLEKEGKSHIALEECQKVASEFLKGLKPKIEFTVPEKVEKEICDLTDKLVIFRATAKYDWYGELESEPKKEIPTRAPQQLIQLYKALKFLDPDYSDERALEILRNIVDSSGDPITKEVYKTLEKYRLNPRTTAEIADELKRGYKTVYSRLNLLWALDVVERFEETSTKENGKPYNIRKWALK